MRIGLDIMGSDHGPAVVVHAAVMAARDLPQGVRMVLIGNNEAIAAALAQHGADAAGFDIVSSEDDITMHDSATKALQSKPRSSISLGFHLLKEGKLDAFASTGNTGAMMVGSVFSVKPIPGVIRPCIPSVVPKENGSYGILLDVGANADCKPDVLVQFGLLGSLLAEHVYHIANPKVGLLNIGEEEKKGNAVTQATYGLMKESNQFNFIGNVEGRDLFNDKADVIVCDGFTGNIVLKAVEAFHDLLQQRGVHEPFFDRFDYENYGGLPVLGVNGNVIIGHGISNEATIKNMVLFTHEVVQSKLNDRIRDAFQ
ncbi:MAG: phosphate acyltransferase PlsX [Flavobacteriales bacterium]|nr:phosphate acyltransferase PlsX [Flavobacteriales bacterium]MBK9196250.1 phosphate acyltransferase PlsX [Flavobacteriales bacterium]MBP6575367.1 phosphate acyltransferase PlsX [Flavobacteriales bacterium]